MKILSVVAILLALALAAMFFVDGRFSDEPLVERRLSNKVIQEDKVILKTGDSFFGKIIGQTDSALLLRPLVYGQHDKTYNFAYQDLKTIAYGDFDTEHRPENPLLRTFFEVQIYQQHINQLYQNRDFEQLEQEVAKLRKNKARFTSGEWKLDAFYRALILVFEKKTLSVMLENLTVLERWQKRYPQSIAAVIMLIEAHTDIAWKHRGGTFSGGVSASGREKFEQHLRIALDLIEQTEASFDIDDPHFYQSSITIYIGLGLLDQKLTGIVQKTIDYDPDYYKVYTKLAPFLMPRWGGYRGGVEDFANWASLQSGSEETYARIATSVRQYGGHASYNRFEFDWQRIKAGYDSLLNRYPTDFYHLHSYTWMACHYHDTELTRELTERINFAWNKQANRVWRRFENYFACQQQVNKTEELLQANLHDEIRAGNFENFVRLLDGNADLNARNDKGETLLTYAINNRFHGFAEALIEKGADPKLRSTYGEAPIHKAAQRGQSQIVQMLLERDVSINSESDRFRWTPLHYAARWGQRYLIQRLLAHPEIRVNQRNSQGRTPLHLAVINGSNSIATLLLVHEDIDVNVADHFNNTALNLAQEHGYAEIEAVLLDKGAIANDDAYSSADVKLATDYHKRGAAEHTAGNYAEAGELYRKSIELYPGNTNTYGNLALIHMHQNDYEACLASARDAIEISRTNAHAVYTAAQCLYLLNRPRDEYLAYYRRYVELEPDNFRTRELLQRYPELRPEKTE